jgi:hypothetical protein
MGTQKAIAERIIREGDNYVLALQGNQWIMRPKWMRRSRS